MTQALTTRQREQFIKLCQAARASIENGDHQEAALYFRYAAQIHPYSTTVWLGLAKLSATDEDKRTALENILAIDPNNADAYTLLATL